MNIVNGNDGTDGFELYTTTVVNFVIEHLTNTIEI